ncbi:MAG: Photosystem I assembly protein Ycf3 [Ignavibacteria bacterium]|nr:Photosystem I assembly protein Ycf3 [Ignavibacteria bacterium]
MIPTGTITFLFTDIEGSTGLSQQFPDSIHDAIDRHNEILKNAFESHNGYIFEIVGDSFCCSFQKAEDAVKAGIKAQLDITNEKWKETFIKIRMGIHSGKAEWSNNKYSGYITLARTQRIMSAANGGQILLSEDVFRNMNDMFNKSMEFRDLGERRLKDLYQPMRLYQLNLPGLKSDFPPLKTLDARPNNLPSQLTNFIGRETELKQIKYLLKEFRLITLTGPGGSGKSRLALQTGADVIDEYSDGVWFMELAALSDPSRLLQIFMKTFNLMEQPDSDNFDIIADNLKEKEMLIILDNCEHLIDELARFADNILKVCSKLKIIATSREALSCHGEVTHRILSLETPDPREKLSPEILSQFEAVRLFIERAEAVRSDFKVDNENAAALAAICYQLDGIPLAIELAAARVKVLTLEKIHERLSDRFKLLTDGKRTALPRQQTLLALINWSYDLLSDKEKILWNRLSVFSGGWTLAAAEEICSDNILDKSDVLDILSSLVEKSIVIFKEEKDRFDMLQTIRQYGEDKLILSNEYEKFSNNHLCYFLELSETENNKIRRADTESAMKVLEEESDNADRSILWSSKNQECEKGMRLTAAMCRYWQIRSFLTEGINKIEFIIKSCSQLKNQLYAKLICQLGNFNRLKGENDAARNLIGESLKIRENLKDKDGIIDSLVRFGLLEYDQGNFDEALNYYMQSLDLYIELGSENGIAILKNNMGNIYSIKGEYEKAYVMYEESLLVRNKYGDKLGYAITLNNMGIISYERGDFQKAAVFLDESLTVRKQLGEKNGVALTLMNIGNLNYNQGKYPEAIDFYINSKDVSEEVSDKSCLADAYYGMGKTYIETGDTDKALNYLTESLDLSKNLKSKALIAANLFSLGKIYFKNDDILQAKKSYKESAAIYFETGSKKDVSVLLIRIAELKLKEKHFCDSANLAGYIQKEYLENLKIKFPVSEQQVFEKILNALSGNTSKEEIDKCLEKGKQFTVNEVAALISKN